MRLSSVFPMCGAIVLLGAFAGGAAAQTPTLPYGHVHLNVPDQAGAVAWYVKVTTEPRPLTLADKTTIHYAYVEGPAGAKIELVQR